MTSVGINRPVSERIASGRPYLQPDPDLLAIPGVTKTMLERLSGQLCATLLTNPPPTEDLCLDDDGRLDVNDPAIRPELEDALGRPTADRALAARPFVSLDNMVRVNGVGPGRLPALHAHFCVVPAPVNHGTVGWWWIDAQRGGTAHGVAAPTRLVVPPGAAPTDAWARIDDMVASGASDATADHDPALAAAFPGEELDAPMFSLSLVPPSGGTVQPLEPVTVTLPADPGADPELSEHPFVRHRSPLLGGGFEYIVSGDVAYDPSADSITYRQSTLSISSTTFGFVLFDFRTLPELSGDRNQAYNEMVARLKGSDPQPAGCSPEFIYRQDIGEAFTADRPPLAIASVCSTLHGFQAVWRIRNNRKVPVKVSIDSSDSAEVRLAEAGNDTVAIALRNALGVTVSRWSATSVWAEPGAIVEVRATGFDETKVEIGGDWTVGASYSLSKQLLGGVEKSARKAGNNDASATLRLLECAYDDDIAACVFANGLKDLFKAGIEQLDLRALGTRLSAIITAYELVTPITEQFARHTFRVHQIAPVRPTRDRYGRTIPASCVRGFDRTHWTWTIDEACVAAANPGSPGGGGSGLDGTITADNGAAGNVLVTLSGPGSDFGRYWIEAPGLALGVASDYTWRCLARKYPIRDWLPPEKLLAYWQQESEESAVCPSEVPNRVLSRNATNWILRMDNSRAYFLDEHSVLYPIDSGGVYVCLAQKYYVLDQVSDDELDQFPGLGVTAPRRC